MKNDSVSLVSDSNFVKSGKILITSKEHYVFIINTLLKSNYQFLSGKEYDPNDIPLGISWYPSANPKKSGTIRKTKFKKVYIHYLNPSLKNFNTKKK